MATKVSKVPTSLLLRFSAWFKRRELWLLVGGGLALILLLYWLAEPFAGIMGQAGQLRAWILSFGAMAPAVYIGVFSLQVLIAPLPGQFMGVMGGYLFGVGLGSLYSISGMLLGAGLAIWLARRFGRPLLERFFDPTDLQMWEKKLRIRSPLTWWLLFLSPVPDLIFYVAGLSPVRLRTLLIALVAGRGLGLLFANAVGHWSAYLSPEVVLVQWGVLLVLAAVVYLYQRRLRLLLLVGIRRLRGWRRRLSLA